MLVKQKQIYNGFKIESELEIKNGISVLTGKNGSGKSRFFESLKNGASTASINGYTLNKDFDIILVNQEKMIPVYGISHDMNNYNNSVSNFINAYARMKSDLDNPFNDNSDRKYSDKAGGPGYYYTHKIINFISNKVGKKPSLLSEAEIKLHYSEVTSDTLGNHNISAVFNRYLKRMHDNDYNEFISSKKNDPRPYYSEENFLIKFGEKPWLVINRILESTFDGKYYFKEPDQSSSEYNQNIPLLELGGRGTTVESLSSGERILLWLALTLFNSQYHDKDLFSIPKLLLLDEPDAFLHPKMVEKMYAALNGYNKQFDTKIILITHSPTTVALAPDDGIFKVSTNSIDLVDKDAGIAELLDGVPQVSLDPKNARQVYVESYYDCNLYQTLYNHLRSRPSKVNPIISIVFIASGPKIPQTLVEEKVRQLLNINDQTTISNFLTAINGCGNCDQVYGTVDGINSNGRTGVRGLVDWDGKNTRNDFVEVLGFNYFYAIENIILDPICLWLQLHLSEPLKFPMSRICGKNIEWAALISDRELMQQSLDNFIKEIFNSDNNRDAELNYKSGINIKTDNRYLLEKGHVVEGIIFNRFPELKKIANPQRNGELKQKIAINIMVTLTSGAMIPSTIEDVLSRLQQ